VDGWIDSHAHLAMFDPGEVGEVLDRAAAAGVEGVLVPATGAGDLDRVLELAEAHGDRVLAAAGLHPHEASTLDDGLKRRLQACLERPGVVAVGEAGLDYHYMSSPREDQLATLEWQLGLAAEAGLPVVLHNRESFDDLAGVLRRWAGRVSGVCHSFTEPPPAVREVVALGFRVGVSGMVTFRRADNIRTMAAAVPHDAAMVETDSPFLAPEPYRGRRNEPAYVADVGRALAEVWGEPAERVARRTAAVFRTLFGVHDSWPAPR